MAWPCISRVCCLARFWDQFDKSDLSVPLTIQNYSDIAEQEVRSVAKQVRASERAPPHTDYSPARVKDYSPARAAGTRTRREPTYKQHPHSVPFPSITQYKQDYKPWPIPRKDNFPWISNGAGSGGPHRGTRDIEGVPGQQQQQRTEPSPTSSYRQEFRPWTGVRPAKSSRTSSIPVHCATPGTEATQVAPETSYQAAYSGDSLRAAGSLLGDSVLPSALSHVQTATAHSPSSTHNSTLPERERAGSLSLGSVPCSHAALDLQRASSAK